MTDSIEIRLQGDTAMSAAKFSVETARLMEEALVKIDARVTRIEETVDSMHATLQAICGIVEGIEVKVIDGALNDEREE